MSESDALEDRKGRRVKLLGDTAKKHRDYIAAWIDIGKNHTREYYYLIVEKPDPEDPERAYLEGPVRGKKVNVVDPDPTPTTYIQAAFQQVPQLGYRLTDFAKMVAKCRIQRGRELSNIIKAYIDRENLNLLKRGSNAEYRLIDTSELPNVVPPDNYENAPDID